ncbi:MAG: penicillin-binding protein activator [Deltaproteobacteria bacterium]|nr:penicillin-binding protein activator [Deltaproteobacteria bacterium]
MKDKPKVRSQEVGAGFSLRLKRNLKVAATSLLFAAYCILLTGTAFALESSPPAAAQPMPIARIGVILPLSGKYATFGEQALKGILLAAGIFETKEQEGKGARRQDNIQTANVEIIIKDTRDDPIASANAVEYLALNENVVGIIGPLLTITSTDAAGKAQELKVPTIVLSQKEGITNAGDYIFRNFLLPSEQAKAIALYAMNKLNRKKFAVLYPNSPYGTELANLFKEEVKKGKGVIVAEEQYKEGQTYFGKEVVRLFKIKETEKKEGRRSIRTFKATVTADALYIPDYFNTIGLIAPHLAYYNIKDIKLLGSNGWNSPKLIELAGKYVEGAVFTDGFFAGSKREATLQFVNNFKDIYGTEPGIIEAQAYDAARIMIEAIAKWNGGKEEIRAILADLKNLPGATGNIAFDKDREAVKDIFMLEVRKGKIVEVKD